MEEDDKECLKEAGEILKAGGLVAFPTETVYGLGGDALNPDSSRKIYAARADRPTIRLLCIYAGLKIFTGLWRIRRKAGKCWQMPRNFPMRSGPVR